MTGRYIIGSVLFVLGLSYKQMALYYALAVFAYILGLIFQSRRPILMLITVSVTVIVSFAVIFSPWLTSIDDILQGLAGYRNIMTHYQNNNNLIQ